MPSSAPHPRTVLAIGGSERREFLQGLVSNDIGKLADGLVYAALLTPQGKYLADFFLMEEGDHILLDVAEPLAAGLLKRLTMYKLRADVTVTTTDRPVTCGLGTAPPGALPDPRHPDLGWRHYDTAPVEDVNWDERRVALCIPEAGVELIPDDTYILEAGFERLNGVDFRKGCYVGQEVTARMKHKTTLRKGLAQVHIDGAAPIGTQIRAGDKVVGTLFTQSGGKALAHLRYDQAQGDMSAGDAIVRRISAGD